MKRHFIEFRNTILVYSIMLFSFTLFFSPHSYAADEPKSCVEGNDVTIFYGEIYACKIETPGDIDAFRFSGTAGDFIRIQLSGYNFSFNAAEAEIFDNGIPPNSITKFKANNSFDFTIEETGRQYTLLVSETGNDSTIGYTVSLQCVVGSCQNTSSPPPSSSARLINISTRGWVSTGDSVMIGGFIIGGSTAKKVLITAKGPALADANVPSVLNDPHLTLYNPSGQVIVTNDDWGAASNVAEIQIHPASPRYSQESAILTTLNPGPYTAIVRGVGATIGNALIEVYEVQ